jgi:DNA replication and repair protein RecF
MNVLVGGNGQGKTNVLEAIAYLGLTKSFFSTGDALVLRHSEETFVIDGRILTDAGSTQTAQISFDRASGTKEIRVNGILLERPTELIGRFPVVVLSPESARITSGPPGERRKFLDMVLAQRSRSYLEDLLEYRKVLRQRNHLLVEAKAGRGMDHNLLEPWTESLAGIGGRIVARRRDFVREFQGVLLRTHETLAGTDDAIGLSYRTTPPVPDGSDAVGVAECLGAALRDARNAEFRRGVTLAGPQRDDLVMILNGMSVQEHASQGQHKTFLLAMKIAEFAYLAAALEETPVLLLDDLFGELDLERSGRIVALVSTLGQSIITTTSATNVGVNGTARRFLVKSGTCEVIA